MMKKWHNKNKYLSLFLCAVITLGVLCSCGSQSTAKKVSMYDLCKVMQDAMSIDEEMSYASMSDSNAESVFGKVCKIDYDKVDDFFVLAAKNGQGNADEIIVVCLKNADDVKEAENALATHKDYRISLYSTYDTTQLTKLEAAKIFTLGNYAVLVVCDKASAVKTAFENYVTE